MGIKLQNEFGFLTDIPKDTMLLRDKYIEPPFSILDTKQGTWQNRKRAWLALGMKSELGRDGVVVINNSFEGEKYGKNGKDRKGMAEVSIFDPVLTELMYKWFCPEDGNILDPFAGGSVRGIVASYLGYHYDGIELRKEQVDSNREQATNILPVTNQPQWYAGDSNQVLDREWLVNFDFIFSCPPYADLEVYSDLPTDLSTMPYNKFIEVYRSIINKSVKLLKPNCFACFVVGEVRNKSGHYYGLVKDTTQAFIDAGMKFYNDAVLLNAIGSAPIRASSQFPKGSKLVKLHQNVLIFQKPAF